MQSPRNLSLLILVFLTSLTLDQPVHGQDSAEGARSSDPVAAVEAIADDYWAGLLDYLPELGVILGSEADLGALSHASAASAAEWQTSIDGWSNRLDEVNAASLSGSTAAVLHSFLEAEFEKEAEQRVCRSELWATVSHMTGYQRAMIQFLDATPVGTASQREAALRRFAQIDRRFAEEMANLRVGIDLGYTQAEVVVQSTMAQLDGLLGLPAEASPLYGPARRANDEGFSKEWRRVIEEDVLPGVTAYRDFLRDDYRPKARSDDGLWALPDGETCYAAQIQGFTGLALSPDEVHEIGLREVARISMAMGDLAEARIGTRDFQTLGPQIFRDPANRLTGRDEILGFAEQVLARAKEAMPRLFTLNAYSELEIRPVPEFQQATSAGGYYARPPADGSRPGVYFLNLGSPQTKVNLEALSFHEGIPGHHWQIALAVESAVHPMTRYLQSTAFVEGWGLYSESLARELGLYSSPDTEFGAYGSELFRAVRLVVDTGIHSKGWSRAEADAYAVQAMGGSLGNELARYVAYPGQATAYMLGKIEIERMRRQAESALGAGFDIRDFHDKMLESGTVPLPFLNAKMEAWISSVAETAGG